MPTYASATAMKWLVLGINSLIFVLGFWIMTQGSIQMIGVEGIATPSGKVATHGSGFPTGYYQDRFPSVGSAGVIFIFGILIMGTAGLGILAVNLEDPGLLDTFGYTAFICCFIKFLFIFASIQMHAFNYNYDPIAFKPVIASICISVMELILGMCGCQLAKVLKRGDAAEPRIQTLPSTITNGNNGNSPDEEKA